MRRLPVIRRIPPGFLLVRNAPRLRDSFIGEDADDAQAAGTIRHLHLEADPIAKAAYAIRAHTVLSHTSAPTAIEAGPMGTR